MEEQQYQDLHDESLGRKRSWVSQLKYCEPLLNITRIGSGAGHASFWFEQKGCS